MQVIDIAITDIFAAEWNANEMDSEMRARLQRSIERFGMLVPLVVRQVAPGRYETIGGAQRLAVSREMGFPQVPCVVVEAGDAEARLLSQALNHIAGQDNPGLRGEVLRKILESTPENEVAGLLPGPLERLRELTSIGEEDLAEYLKNRLQTQKARLEHLAFQLTPGQRSIVQAALHRAGKDTPGAQGGNPNRRGNALAAICQKYIEKENTHDDGT